MMKSLSSLGVEDRSKFLKRQIQKGARIRVVNISQDGSYEISISGYKLLCYIAPKAFRPLSIFSLKQEHEMLMMRRRT